MEEQKEKIKYPKLLDEYFKSNIVILKQIPDKYRILKEDSLPDKQFKSTKTFVDYLNRELAFWSYKNLSRNHMVSRFDYYYNQALKNIGEAISFVESNPTSSTSYLQKAINVVVSNCQISSKTKLAQKLKEFQDKESYFFHGFESAILVGQTGNYYNNLAWQEGFYYGMQYKQAISSIKETVKTYQETYQEAVKNAENTLSSFDEKSTILFHEQEEKVKALWDLNNQKLKQQEEENTKFIQDKQEKMQTLEDTYNKKLQLSEPAEYWKKLSKSYKWKGIFWFALSFLIAGGIVTGIIFLIKLTPQLFQENKYWLDLIKDTALLTVITSVVIYILRITIKLAISSFHLSRDAKEREMLTGFYLSINSENAVSESERVIIINSLFSRADTGLLKGDSSPTMSANISDLYSKDKSR